MTLTFCVRLSGDLYSVKIMWPRTPEERARNRHTGFVCFMNRSDAEDAMRACDESDPFNVGRPIMVRWGKNVKKIVRKGTGGLDIAPIQKKVRPTPGVGSTSTVPRGHHQPLPDNSIRVVVPADAKRASFISTVASFVAKDGSQLETRILALEHNNPQFSFLTVQANGGDQQLQEHIYYKWRVYSFCQGDSFSAWRTEAFTMLQPNGVVWVPPPLNHAAAIQEQERERLREETIMRNKRERQHQNIQRNFVTGRQLEQARRGARDGTKMLSQTELDEFGKLTRKQLCSSRQSICEAMAFFFEKSGAAVELSSMLKALVLERPPTVSVETRIARLHLLSDVLYNSQQAGVRNAFKYRDAIEKMAPEVFKSLGEDGDGSAGRMTRNKLATAVSGVLGAWTNWSVYDHAFIDELQARFDGREIVQEVSREDEAKQEDVKEAEDEPPDEAVVSETPRGDWTSVTPADQASERDRSGENHPASLPIPHKGGNSDPDAGNDPDGESIGSEDADGDPLDDDPDGDPLDDDVDGVPLPRETGDLYGEALNSHEEADGLPLDEDVDGEALESDIDGEPLDENASATDVDGEALDEDVDGAPL